MRKLAILLGVILTVVYVNKLYFPPLPIDGLSPKEAIQTLKASHSKIVQIAEEGEHLWYLTKIENKGIDSIDETIKQLVTAKGYQFKEKDGAGLFFEKEGDRLIATTQMWTKKYVIVKIPRVNSYMKE